MYSSAGERTARETLRYFEQVRGFFAENVAGIQSGAPLRIVLFAAVKDYEPYRINEFASADYRAGANCDYIVMSQPSHAVLPVAVHEYVHRLVRHADLKLPPWLNEGVAELYSTLKPYGNKIMVGDLIPGRHQAVLREKWTPLAVILAAGHDSPYYTEKTKAGSLYNEGWALTHMLALSQEYRPRYPQFVQAIADGTESAAALEKVYRKPLTKIERDLQAYLRGDQFRAALFPGKLAKIKIDEAAEPVAEFDVLLMQAELMNQPGRQSEARALFQKLTALDARRPEPHSALGYLALREGGPEAAHASFERAYALGGRQPQFLWDYGRMAVARDPGKAAAALEELLKVEPGRVEARLELAAAQLNGERYKEALAALAPMRTVRPEHAARFFTLATYAHLRGGDRASAEATARRWVEVARADQKQSAEALLAQVALPPALPGPAAPEGPPRLKRAAPREEFQVVERFQTPLPRPKPAADGVLVKVDCMGAEAKLHLEAGGARKVFLIDQPNDIIVEGSADGHATFVCGPQKGQRVHIEYEPPLPGQAGVAGRLRLIRFQP
jgi:tetratricopeptide (TPR) repeat protein